ncbi:hypothetical protein T11_18187 [Trichinella zimbabwensis]|uniref:CCHC-type domain-containing protein n=1 Tax=Trichinella zimbabwensis TaxID=268475 RepID=A0A0V1GQ39_9BILA|nr:hypothetical protein T11_8742 [Trichinella zimbabwensis]KRZ00310.1 hypothetical protein T11_18187 [Trichinella zimbabwensis]
MHAAASRLEWDKLVKADEKLRSDLTAFQQKAEAMADFHRSELNRNSETSSKSNATNSTTCKGGRPVGNRQTATFLHASVAHHCPICNGSHKAPDCPEVLKADHSQRKMSTKKAGLCFSCFDPGHLARKCGQRGGRKNSGRRCNSPAALASGKFSDPPQDREQKEGEQPRPVRVNLASVVKSGGTWLQVIQALN